MANRVPLVIVSTETGYEIKELPNADTLFLQSNSIDEVEDITAFGTVNVGNLIVNGTSIDPADITSTNSGNSPFRLAQFTTAQRDELSLPGDGDMIYNLTTQTFQGYSNGSWADLNA